MSTIAESHSTSTIEYHGNLSYSTAIVCKSANHAELDVECVQASGVCAHDLRDMLKAFANASYAWQGSKSALSYESESHVHLCHVPLEGNVVHACHNTSCMHSSLCSKTKGPLKMLLQVL